MRLYSPERLETLRTPKLLKQWHSDGLLTAEQNRQLNEDIASDWHTTNPFLRIALFLFAVVILALIEGLFYLLFGELLFGEQAPETAWTVLLLLSSVACYAGAEYAIHEFRLFHFGIEEALVVSSIGFLFLGLQFQHRPHQAALDLGEFAIVAVCAGVSLWTWYRFSYWYTFVASMVFVAAAACCLPASLAAERTLIVLGYAAGLAGLTAARRKFRHDALHTADTAAEALLWAGMYLSINLVLSGLFTQRYPGWIPAGRQPSAAFYWLTWALTWCLPPVLLVHGIRRRERTLLGLGAVLLVVTFACNKPYLHWQRHPWDPMLMGAVLMGVALGLQRWLSSGAEGIRNGFTAARVTAHQGAWMAAGASVFSLVAPHAMLRDAQPGMPQAPRGEGGTSGGGGAGGTF